MWKIEFSSILLKYFGKKTRTESSTMWMACDSSFSHRHSVPREGVLISVCLVAPTCQCKYRFVCWLGWIASELIVDVCWYFHFESRVCLMTFNGYVKDINDVLRRHRSMVDVSIETRFSVASSKRSENNNHMFLSFDAVTVCLIDWKIDIFFAQNFHAFSLFFTLESKTETKELFSFLSRMSFSVSVCVWQNCFSLAPVLPLTEFRLRLRFGQIKNNTNANLLWIFRFGSFLFVNLWIESDRDTQIKKINK